MGLAKKLGPAMLAIGLASAAGPTAGSLYNNVKSMRETDKEMSKIYADKADAYDMEGSSMAGLAAAGYFTTLVSYRKVKPKEDKEE